MKKKGQRNTAFVGRKSVKKDIKVVQDELDIDEESSVYLSQEAGGSTRAGKSSKYANGSS
jgi:hypothetical protein